MQRVMQAYSQKAAWLLYLIPCTLANRLSCSVLIFLLMSAESPRILIMSWNTVSLTTVSLVSRPTLIREKQV